MFVFVTMFIVLSVFYMMYERFVPVFGIRMIKEKEELLRDDTVILDVRDYNLASPHPVEGVLHVPYAYLKRYHRDIYKKDIILITSDRLLLNISARFLQRKGFRIIGYYNQEFQTKNKNMFCIEHINQSCRSVK